MIVRDTKEEFLNIMEDWIKEVIVKKADGETNRIPSIVKEGFRDSMKANEEYHKDMARMLEEAGDGAVVRYHLLMSDIYKSISSKE